MFLTVVDRSSIVLHILLRVNIYFTIFWFILEVPLLIFKYYHLPYASNAFGLEMSIIFMLCLNEFLRHFFGIKGNLIMKMGYLAISAVYGGFSMVGFIFFLVLQSYTQRVEILLSAIGLTLITIEIIFSIITMININRLPSVLTREQKSKRTKKAQEQFEALLKKE